jgi:uncharacterized protein (DUF2225 family)
MDSDFCGYYDNGVNPDFYVVRVCPSCGYASTENGFNHLNDKQKIGYYERIGASWQGLAYSGERTAEQAMETYKLALLTAQSTGAADRVIAGLLHHIAWLYRYEGDEKQERKFLTFALDAYVRVYELEGISLNNARLMFLIGELNRRIGERHEAVKWFSRVVSDKSIMDAAMIRACREQWQLVREEMGSSSMAGGGSEKASTA